jgi:hypothetical protein
MREVQPESCSHSAPETCKALRNLVFVPPLPQCRGTVAAIAAV